MTSDRPHADPERLYRTVYELQGVRHPVTAPEALDRAGAYLLEEMAARGLGTRPQTFTLGDHPQVFTNVEGRTGAVDEQPATVLVSHYDTVPKCPGANDNAAGVAVCLEAGRIIATLKDPPPLYVLAVTLEESSNPLYAGQELASARRHGVIDENLRYTSWGCCKYKPLIFRRAIQLFEGGATQGEGYRVALEEYAAEIPANLRAHVEDLTGIYEGMTKRSAIGSRSRIGSSHWVAEALETGRRLSDCITLDEVGIFTREPGSQRPSEHVDFSTYTSSYRLQPEERTGDFIIGVATAPASHLARRFAEKCRLPEIDLPYGMLDLPIDFDYVVERLPKGLGSDHAPFWQHGIPALFIYDSAELRDNWNHTEADLIENLDFTRLAQLTEAVVETILVRR